MANQEPEELLNALESIKGLLEKSESKLNAARESIELATPAPDLNISDDITSQDVVFDIPELDEIVVPAVEEGAQPTVDMEALKVFLDEMQK